MNKLFYIWMNSYASRYFHTGKVPNRKKNFVTLLQPPSVYLPTPFGVQKAIFFYVFCMLWKEYFCWKKIFSSLVNTSHKLLKNFMKKFLSTRSAYPPPLHEKNFLCRFGWFRTWKKNNKFGVGWRPSTYLGCSKPTPFFFF